MNIVWQIYAVLSQSLQPLLMPQNNNCCVYFCFLHQYAHTEKLKVLPIAIQKLLAFDKFGFLTFNLLTAAPQNLLDTSSH